jgi:Uma2 family endonuclease
VLKFDLICFSKTQITMLHTQLFIKRHPAQKIDFSHMDEIQEEIILGKKFRLKETTLTHNEIVGNISSIIKGILRPNGFRVFTQNIKVKASLNYAYPDVIVSYREDLRQQNNYVEEPCMLIEVLSRNREGEERGAKMRMYKEIPSLQYYMLVSQTEFYVELFTRTEQKDIWTYQTFDQPSDIINFELLNFNITLSGIYENIVFIPDEETA